MLAIVTRLFFIMGHGSLEVRLEDGRRLVSGCSTAFIIICIIVDSSGLDDIHVHVHIHVYLFKRDSLYTIITACTCTCM